MTERRLNIRILTLLFICLMAGMTHAIASDNNEATPKNIAKRPLRGDVNGDGGRNVTDVSLIVQFILHPEAIDYKLFDPEMADLNFDGSVTVSDVTILVNVIMGASFEDPDNPDIPIGNPEGDDPANGV